MIPWKLNNTCKNDLTCESGYYVDSIFQEISLKWCEQKIIEEGPLSILFGKVSEEVRCAESPVYTGLLLHALFMINSC